MSILQDQINSAIRVWLECPVEKRPSAQALGIRVAEIAALHSTSAAGETTSSDDPNSILREIWNDIEFAAVEAPTDDYQSDDIRPETLARLANYLDARGWKDKDNEVHRQPNVDTSSDDRGSAVVSEPVRRSGAADLSQPVNKRPSEAISADVLAMKSCPFCGEQPSGEYLSKRPRFVRCEMCGCRTPDFNNAGLAVKRWNARAAIDKLSPEESEAKYLSGWMTDQYNAGAKPPVGSPNVKAEGGRGEPVAIKPLEWDKHPDEDEWFSRDHGLYDVSEYLVYKSPVSTTAWCLKVRGILLDEDFLGPDAAKAAAQADYEQRIRSALVAHPASPPDVEAIARDAELLDFFEKNIGMELSCSWEDDDGPWEVHNVTGGRNDREWTKVGQGATPREAITSAIRTGGQK